jgi:ABC-2 type transport system ATP-binding protein
MPQNHWLIDSRRSMQAISAAGPDVLLRVAGLTKRFGRVTALDDVGFTIRRGEVVGLIGPNGAGKTTLFECVGGVLPRDAGTIGDGMRTLGDGERRSRLFYLPDAVAPWPAQPLRWALEFSLGYFGGAAAARDPVIASLGLEPLLDTPIGALSKGQRKRGLLALGLLAPQPILLADEPFDGLDLRQTREVAATLRRHAAAGRTLFLSIHQIGEAARVCDRFVLLSGGRVRGEGTHAELAARVRGAAADHPLEEVFLALTA